MKVERVCIVCGSIFAAWPYSIKKGQAKYCSRTCFHKRNKKQICSVPGCNKPRNLGEDYKFEVVHHLPKEERCG